MRITFRLLRLPVAALGAILIACLLLCARADDRAITGPNTEKRFPPLHVPDGFQATLFACDPFIEYPSAIALGPRPGSIFVAVDYMTGLGTEIVRRDEIRLIEDTDGDGYADKSTVYAAGFNSIEGLTFHDGVVYAMHSPQLTALRDNDGDGVADDRRDLLTGLGLPPEENPPRLHCANGIVWGYDGWLYLALGDHGCNVLRPEGDRLVLEGGGILRCRPDGNGLHVFASGLRNIYDVALDEDLNVFVRDNENDGGDYKIRICHSFFAADHGYPYLYYERPDECLPPIADLGLGSSAGGLAYLETQFPAEYRGNLFFCEWGRSVVRAVPARNGAGFAPIQELEFASGATNDPYGFKPTDLVVERDGSLIVADWADGQRPKRGRGRIYRITFGGRTAAGGAPKPAAIPRTAADWIKQLDSPSYAERIAAQMALVRTGNEGIAALRGAVRDRKLGVRGLMHATWLLDGANTEQTLDELIDLSSPQYDSRVRLQAIRAIADRCDPTLATNRNAVPGLRLQDWIAAMAEEHDPLLSRELIGCLGRLQWSGASDWIARIVNKHEPDAALAHAAMQALRRTGNWPALLRALDGPEDRPMRAIALRALADRAQTDVVDNLIERLRTEPQAARRHEYADALTRVYKVPGPWSYWGYRPPPRPPNAVNWERTPQIEQTVNQVLLDPDRAVRVAILQRMQREKIPAAPDILAAWLADERDPVRVAVILDSVKEHHAPIVRDLLLGVVLETGHTTENRLAALARLAAGLDETSEECLADLSKRLAGGPVLAAILKEISNRPKLRAGELLIGKLSSEDAEVRAAAADALATRSDRSAAPTIARLLDDPDAQVRSAAAAALGKLQQHQAADALLGLARDPDASVRNASLRSLRSLGDRRVLPLALDAISDSVTARDALLCVGSFGSPDHSPQITQAAKRNSSHDLVADAMSILTRWRASSDLPGDAQNRIDRSIAEIQGSAGVLAAWRCLGPVPAEVAARTAQRCAAPNQSLTDSDDRPDSWTFAVPVPLDSSFAVCPESSSNSSPDRFWVCVSDLTSSDDAAVQFLSSSSGELCIWLNGVQVYKRSQSAGFQPESDRFSGTLVRGTNRLVATLSSGAGKPPRLHVRFRHTSSSAEHEQLVQAALTRTGNVERGRKLFFDAEKSQCIKCHRMNDRGERVGPELTNLGSRFSRIYIIESILEPSRTIAPSYESVTIALKDGRVFTGLRVAQTATTITLADNQIERHVLEKSAIDEERVQTTSIMPDGLEKRFAPDEFVDLITFLVSQTDSIR